MPAFLAAAPKAAWKACDVHGWLRLFNRISGLCFQQQPVIGYLNSRSRDGDTPFLAAFHNGLNETGYVESQNVVSDAPKSAPALPQGRRELRMDRGS